jgi:hypothetical protein
MAKRLDSTELNRRYQEAEACDQELFAEQRSNILLVSGDHYTKRGSRFWSRIKDNKQLSSENKLRLTKNHVQKISKTYKNNITAFAPWVSPQPQNETEPQDKKAAELNKSVWEDLRVKQKLKKKIREWASDYVDLGECFVKIYFDPNAGDIYEYAAKVHPETGEDMTDEEGNLIAGTPRYTGEIKFERYFAFNVLRDPSAKSLDEAAYLILRKMVATSELQAMVGEDEKKLAMLKESSEDTFIVFDGSKGEYTKSKDQILVTEHYYRPCADYPRGYYYICTPTGVLFEGELPFGIFPIKYVGFDEIPTTPRSRSIIKVLRPYQAEINRKASKMAEHQVTLGDDKIVFAAGSKVTHGGQLPGVRGVAVSGPPPTIIPGRSGEHLLPGMLAEIKEMYEVSNVFEDTEEIKANMEPFSLLWRSIRHKKKFSFYAEKFEDFLIEVCETALELAKNYYTDKHLIPVLGRKEYVNIAEFKSTEKLCYQIKVMPQGDDLETMMGKQIQMNHVLQYVGKQLKPDDIGKMIRAMPFMDKESAFGDFTIDSDNATNKILALDRGEYPEVRVGDNHEYMAKKLNHRMNQSDFRLLAPEIQANYARALDEHEAMKAFQLEQIRRAEQGFIPTGGYLVACDFYVPDAKDPTKSKRVKLPSEGVQWFIKQLENQGSALQFEEMPQAVAAGIAGQLGAMSTGAMGGDPSNAMGGAMPMGPQPSQARLM